MILQSHGVKDLKAPLHARYTGERASAGFVA